MLYSLKKHDYYYKNYNYNCLYSNEISKFSRKSKQKISNIGMNISFKEVKDSLYLNFPCNKKEHALSLLKFKLFDNPLYDYSIYLDTDFLILDSFLPLINHLEMSKLNILGVENKSRSKKFNEYEFLTFDMNAGMFIIKKDLNCFDLIKVEINNLKSQNIPQEMICQPILNSVMSKKAERYISAPCKYNYRAIHKYDIESKFIHFVTRTLNLPKPWEMNQNQIKLSDNFYINLWWKYFNEIKAI